jgi:type VI secretion system ImpH/TssG family protein
VRYERGAVDAISVAIGALFGIPIETGEGVARDYRLRLIPYAGLLSLNNRSASSLSRVISHVFSVPCEIEEFVLRSVRIPDACLFALGERGHELGADTLIGEWLPDAEGCFRIWCGPIPFERYKAFLPNRADWTELRKLTDFVVPGPLDREYGFRIAAGTTPEWALGEGELGWTMWTEPDREATIEVVV